MTDRLPQLKPQEMIRAMERLGFVVRRTTGSHVILRHPTSKRLASIPVHNRDLKRSLMFGILKQANIGNDEFLASL
ncbi:hypothetical protein A3E39_03670 [Candidatus Uhrbacteria bacterium RIFCSPHIGHO2_12_FULL_60_25]|uniref:Toxin HicA n=1 Tax=Candidatus Uhrbacteria bacterium RIFCSPHIGHO2_12_FULL_60_25 TaxID=1802399 RepID=A0A1F7UMT9_9BACT|nr:MAG: hypothetical protein A3D73_01510 [Candidatus Uhrbacteria bacterium RIFCSPHIGHO2_02_FULL_60_44]OGL79018.1 MAG: hypothetical protein A3E39_03670 [Candidatus Uhrbacteria bacterium RIFCSPHIGHO2_12_FULL_60_25]